MRLKSEAKIIQIEILILIGLLILSILINNKITIILNSGLLVVLIIDYMINYKPKKIVIRIYKDYQINLQGDKNINVGSLLNIMAMILNIIEKNTSFNVEKIINDMKETYNEVYRNDNKE